jgi:predicted  nucleic acid-binding Zn-ribbon protein
VESDFDKLNRLQEIDSEISNITLFLESIPTKTEEIDQKIESTLSKAEQARNKLNQNQKRRRGLEAEVQDIRIQIDRYRRQLGGVKSNKEYSTLLKEIDLAQEKIDELEEEQISEMLQADEIAEEIKAADEEVRKAKEKLSEEKKILFAEKEKKEKIRSTLRKEKKDLISTIPDEFIENYMQIFAKKNGIALSPVTDDFCSICQIRIRPQMLNELKAKREIILCENCGRILYWLGKSA